MKYLTVLVLLSLVLPLVACSSELSPQTLASSTQNIVAKAKDENNSVFDEIQRNIDLVAELKAKVQEAQLGNKEISLKNIVRDIEEVTQSYEKLSEQRDNIRQELLNRVKRVEQIQKSVAAEIKALWEKRVSYAEQLRLVSDPNPDIARTRKEALTRAIKYVDAQIELWKEFSNVQRHIIIEMSEIQRTIDSFLAMIESTAIVFREGLNLLYLQQNIEEAIALFASDIPRMEQLTESMQQSWDNLDYLVEALTGIANIKIAK